MKKFGYLLSLAGHLLLLLIILNTRFQIIIRPQPPPQWTLVSRSGPPRIVGISLAEPPRTGFARIVPGSPLPGGADRKLARDRGAGGEALWENGGTFTLAGGLTSPAWMKFDLARPAAGDFRLSAVGIAPEPWATPIGPVRPPRMLRYAAGAFRPGAVPGGSGGPGGAVMLPFDIREKAVADWTEAVLSRIERNWFIPTSGRLAFSGRVQITLTIGRQGLQDTLVIDDASVPEPLTQAALHAVQASLPLPPIPENVAGESLALTFVFSYNG
jgi:hypothetical protein